jgi:phospholipase C
MGSAEDLSSQPSRRQLLAGAAGGVAAAALAAGSNGVAQAATLTQRRVHLPKPHESLVDHIVVLMMENRSFDHFLGWLPSADGQQKGLHFPDANGTPQRTWHLPFTQSCGHPDPDHSYHGGRIQYAHGKLDGWLLTDGADTFPIGYYEAEDLPFYKHAATHWTTCDRYFAATLGPTYPNRFYMHAAQTDRKDDSTTQCTLPTIWDRLADAGVSHTYYFSDTPFTALWYGKYGAISQHVTEFTAAAKAGTLPAVSFVDPHFVGESNGSSGDDHPLADIRVGQKFVSDIYTALVNSPQWDRTLLVVNYDEWGGFYDHVKPTRAPDADPRFARRGFRVPTMIMGPRARRRHISHHTFDHTSVLKMIEWRWGLKPLTPRDKAANNLAIALDFSGKPDVEAPTWTVPDATAKPCPSTTTAAARSSHHEDWLRLREIAERHGFSL